MFMIPTIDMVATGKNIKMMRKAAGISIKDLQDDFGFSTPQAIYKWQRGDAMPTIDNLVILAALFKVKIDDILEAAGFLLSGQRPVLSAAGYLPPVSGPWQ